jgi:hypothetical protein
MTEDQIERAVERKVDALDAIFMAGTITQTEYDSRMRDISDWADRQYAATAKRKDRHHEAERAIGVPLTSNKFNAALTSAAREGAGES